MSVIVLADRRTPDAAPVSGQPSEGWDVSATFEYALLLASLVLTVAVFARGF